MSIIILPIVTTVLYTISFFLLLRDEKKTALQNNETDMPLKKQTGLLVYSVIALVLLSAVNTLFCTLYKTNSVLESLKSLTLLCVIWPVAYIDFKTYRIPNAFIIFGLICRILLLLPEFIIEGKATWHNLISEAVAAAALLIAALLCALCIKNSIGAGDMKLFVVMGLLLGIEGIWSAIFLALIISFIASVYLLATKKKKRKDSIPFGPAIVMGTFLSVCLSGM